MYRSICFQAEKFFRIGIFILILSAPFPNGHSSAAAPDPLPGSLTPDEAITWVGPTIGDWNTPDNWSTESIPGASADVGIGAGNTVTFSSGTTTFNWSAGTMEGPADTAIYGVMNITGSVVKTLGSSGKPRDLHLYGIGSWSEGDIDTYGGSSIMIHPGANLAACGALDGDLYNQGALQVGCSTGVLSVRGDYIQDATGVLDIEIGGSGVGQLDQLSISSVATLGGSLNVDLINGYSLNSESIDILIYSSHKEEFTTHDLPAGVFYAYNEYALTIWGGIPIYLPLICKPD